MTAPVPDAVPSQSAAGDEEMAEHFMQALDEAGAGDVPAPTVPDEALAAVQAELEKHWHSYVKDSCDCGEPDDSTSWHHAKVVIRTAAPFIVAANQPHVHTWQRDEATDSGNVEWTCPAGHRTITTGHVPVAIDPPIPPPPANQPDAAEVERLRAQREAVLALHVAVLPSSRCGCPACLALPAGCAVCRELLGDWAAWPCDTARELGITDTP